MFGTRDKRGLGRGLVKVKNADNGRKEKWDVWGRGGKTFKTGVGREIWGGGGGSTRTGGANRLEQTREGPSRGGGHKGPPG